MKYRHAFVVLALLAIGPYLFAETQSVTITPDNFSFGDHEIGTVTETTFTIHNQSKSKLKIWVAPLTGDYLFERNECQGTLDADGSCTVTIRFSPTQTEPGNGSLEVAYSPGPDGKPAHVAATLQGKGSMPDLSISPAQIQFARQRVSTTSPAEILTLTNTTNTATANTNTSAREINISMITVSGDFPVQSQSCSLPLKPGTSCTVILSFSPKRDGLAQGLLSVTSNSTQSVRRVSLSGKGVGCWSARGLLPRSRELWTVMLIAFLYWMALALVRWNRVAQPTRQWLQAELASLQAELASLTAVPAADKAPVAGLLRAAEALFQGQAWYSRISNFLFWSRGHELTGWGYAHEAEIQMARFLPPEMVKARLETSEQELIAANNPASSALAETIRQAISSNPPASELRCQALLAEALNANYNRADNTFADMVSWQNKTAWLVVCGLLLIVALSGALGRSVLFLVGATGGLLSRLSRSLERKDVPTDYGASWTTLFLSPVAGALGGWTGILLATLVVKVGVLGAMFHVDWDAPYDSTTLAIALLLGTSERAFDSILSKLEGKVSDQSSSSAAKAGLKILTGPDLPPGTVNADYRAELKASGGTGSLVWSTTDGKLPDGLTLNASGVISGKPAATTAGKTFTFTVEVKDNTSKPSQQFTIKIS